MDRRIMCRVTRRLLEVIKSFYENSMCYARKGREEWALLPVRGSQVWMSNVSVVAQALRGWNSERESYGKRRPFENWLRGVPFG